MSVNRRIRLNLRNFGNLPAVMLSQYDEGYNLVFEIFDGASAAGDLSGYTATLKGVRSDTLSYSFTGTISNNVLTFEIDTTMTGVAGKGTAEIVLTASGVVFATFNMPVFVERAAVPDGSIDADVTRAEEVAEQIQQIVDTAAEQVTAETEQIVGDLEADVSQIKEDLNPLLDADATLEFVYKCVGYYYNSSAKKIMSSANLETFKYNIPNDCVAVRIQSNFYASQIMFSNTDATSATFPSMSINLNEIALRPATTLGSATNVDITYIINDDNRYKYLYVPHYVADPNPVVVTATIRGEISALTYGKIDAAGRYRRKVPTGEDIFTSEGFTSGYILSNGTGGTTANPNYGYTDYIDVEGNSFTLDGISGNGFSVVYDENKSPLGSGAISLFFDKDDRPDGTKYIRFNVYLTSLPSVKMNVYETVWVTYITPSQVIGGYTDITVGTGKQFTSVVEAVEYANGIASDYNTVNVYIYPGTYNIIEEYDLSEQVSSWNGLTLADHVNLIGVGSPDKVVLSGELPTDITSYAFDRNNVSTLNFWKNNSIKNLTITAKNMRYCLHNEDGKVYAVENAVETIENCVFIYYENDTGIVSSRVPVGIGAAAGRKTTFRNCVFDNQSANGNYPLLLHNNTNAEKYCEWIFESCDFIGGTMNSLKLSSAGSGQTEIVNIIGCRLPNNLRFDRQNVYTGTVCEYKVFGHGNAISGTASWDGVTESASVTEMLID